MFTEIYKLHEEFFIYFPKPFYLSSQIIPSKLKKKVLLKKRYIEELS